MNGRKLARDDRRPSLVRRVALALVVLLLLAACGNGATDDDAAGTADGDGGGTTDDGAAADDDGDDGDEGGDPVQITYATGGAQPPNEMEIAIYSDALIDQGVLEHHGDDYTVDIVSTRSTPEAQSLLVAGQADFATLAFSTIALAVQQDAVPGGISIVAGHFIDGHPDYVSNAYLVREDSGIESAEDLQGRTMGVNAVGSAVDIWLRVWLLENGIDPETDVEFAEVGFPAQGPALREGRIDVASMVQPFQSQELNEGGVRVLFDAEEAAGGENAAIAVVARNEFLEENPEAARAFLADWVNGLQWLSDDENRDEAIEIMSDITGTPPEALDLFYGRPGDDYYRDPNACPNAEALQRGVDAMVTTGYIDEGIEIEPLVDTSYLPEPCE